MEKTTGDQREVIAGVVYDAVKDELYTAEKGQGAQINLHRLRVSGRTKLNQCMIGTGTPSITNNDNNPVILEKLANVAQQVAATRSYGSTVLDLCYVAAGRFDGHFKFGFEDWDIAAAELIVREAGGAITDAKGAKDHYENKTIIASNMHIHQMMVKMVK